MPWALEPAPPPEHTSTTRLCAEAEKVSEVPRKHLAQRHQFKQCSSSARVTQPLLVTTGDKQNKIAQDKIPFHERSKSPSLTPHVVAWDRHRYSKCHKVPLCTQKHPAHPRGVPFCPKQGQVLGPGTRSHLKHSSGISGKTASNITMWKCSTHCLLFLLQGPPKS